jgi:hypothetical protein
MSRIYVAGIISVLVKRLPKQAHLLGIFAYLLCRCLICHEGATPEEIAEFLTHCQFDSLTRTGILDLLKTHSAVDDFAKENNLESEDIEAVLRLFRLKEENR